MYCIVLNYREMNLRAEEERCSRLREELLTLREDMNKAYLSREMLEQQKMESDDLIAQMEKSKGAVIICCFSCFSFCATHSPMKNVCRTPQQLKKTVSVERT
jgi:hypothetical protein